MENKDDSSINQQPNEQETLGDVQSNISEAETYPTPNPVTSTPPETIVTENTQPIQQPNLDTTTQTNFMAEKPHTNSPGVIVLQWLTYAFWGWTALAIFAISTMVITYYIIGSDVDAMIPYGIAAVLVLLPISVICDLIYNKKEPIKKTGAASVVMIIHAVIFALCGVGALVTIVLNIVTMFINGTSDTAQVLLACAVIMTFVYAILFIRTIAHGKIFAIRKLAILLMTLISVILVGFSFAGPAVNAAITKNDKLINDNIHEIVSSIRKYTSSNKKLPDTLSEIKLDGDAKKIVADNLIVYKKEEATTTQRGAYMEEVFDYESMVYKYQLCVNYKKAESTSGYNNYKGYMPETDMDEYETYPTTYGHPAGEVCYKVKTD